MSLDEILAIALAGGGVVFAVWYSWHRLGRAPYKPGRRIERDVDAALSGPAYAPYGGDLLDREDLDAAVRLRNHQRCEAWPCPHEGRVDTRHQPGVGPLIVDHCRCGADWPCPGAGLLNEREFRADPTDEHDRARYRNPGDTRRWPSW